MRPRPRIPANLLIAALVAGTAISPLTSATSASAATADQWGFAYVKDAGVPTWTTLDPAHQWGSWKTTRPDAWAVGGKIAAGRFVVRFPAVEPMAAGIAHVTPVIPTGNYCELLRWSQAGDDGIVEVQCHAPGGAPADTPFTVLWTVSTGILPDTGQGYAYLRNGPNGVLQSYNSTGGKNSVAPGSGIYRVTLSGLGVNQMAGNMQVTAVHPEGAARRCKVADWFTTISDIIATVACFDQTGKPAPSEFTLSYHRKRAVFGSFDPPKSFGYIWSTKPYGQPNFNELAGIDVNTITPDGHGQHMVSYPKLGSLVASHAQVTAYGDGPSYCHLRGPWPTSGDGAALVPVACFDGGGRPATHDFLSTYTART